MTVRRPKFLHPDYQNDFEDAVGPAFRSLVIVPVAAGWAPATVAEGLLALVRAQILEGIAHIASEKTDASQAAGTDLDCRAIVGS